MSTDHGFDLNHIFSYHAPKGDQLEKYQKIRDAGKAFAEIILDNTVVGGDQNRALNKIRDAVMIANASVALEGCLYKAEVRLLGMGL